MNLQLVRHFRQDGTPQFRLEVSTDLDAAAYAADGFSGPEEDLSTGERVLTLYAKDVTTSNTHPQLAYSVPLGASNPVASAAEYLIVKLEHKNGTQLDSSRIDGGTKVTNGSDPEIIGKPL